MTILEFFSVALKGSRPFRPASGGGNPGSGALLWRADAGAGGDLAGDPGGHTLIAAPTGAGKTLAAFLAAIDDLVREGLERGLPALSNRGGGQVGRPVGRNLTPQTL